MLIIALFDLQLSYLLAFLGREQIAETLSITVVTEIIAVMLESFDGKIHGNDFADDCFRLPSSGWSN